jgi:hypothetical protein
MIAAFSCLYFLFAANEVLSAITILPVLKPYVCLKQKKILWYLSLAAKKLKVLQL